MSGKSQAPPTPVKPQKRQTPPVTPPPVGRGLGSTGRLLIGIAFLLPAYAAISLFRLTPGTFMIESVGFLAYRVMPTLLLAVSIVMVVGWCSFRRPPIASTLTLVGAVTVHGVAGLFFFPQTYSILVLPLVLWGAWIVLLVGRLDWVEAPPFFRGGQYGPVVLHPSGQIATPPPQPPQKPEPTPDEGKPDHEAIQERFDRLREELRPRVPERVYPQPSYLFLFILSLLAGGLTIILLLPSPPSTVPLYGQESEEFEAEPLWDPLLLAPRDTPALSQGTGDPPRLWYPNPRQAQLPESWEQKMESGDLRVVFSKRSSVLRVETLGCAASVRPLMELQEVSADGFPLLPWNRGQLLPGESTGWQRWVASDWVTWVRYSGDPWISGAWPAKARQGVGPWLGKVALQILPDHDVVALASVNRLNLALSARHVDLCGLAIEPIREADLRWGTLPVIQDSLSEKSIAELHRSAVGFVRTGQKADEAGNLEPLKPVELPRFQGWLIVRQQQLGPGYLIYAPFWQRQIGIDKPTHTPVGDPSNRVTVTLEGLTTHVRFSLLAPTNPSGSAVSTVAPGTYLNVLLLIPIIEGSSDDTAIETLRRVLADHASPLLLHDTSELAAID